MEEKAPQFTRINQIDIVNPDLQLSEFKHHFILRKVYIPSGYSYNQFASLVAKSFQGVKIENESICFVQIDGPSQSTFHDVFVGFKRDKDALLIYQQSLGFNFLNQLIPIELTDVFQCYLEAKGSLPLSKSKRQAKQGSNQGQMRKKSFGSSDQRNQSRSRSRDRQKSGSKKEMWVGSLWGLYYPIDWSKNSLRVMLTDTLRCARNQIMVEQQNKDGIPYFLLNFRSTSLINTLLNGTRATEGSMLLLKEEEVLQLGLLQAIKIRQIKAVYISTTPCSNQFKQLCKSLISFRQFNLRVVTVVPYEDYFVIVNQNKVQNILKFLKIAGWKFDVVSQCLTFPAESTDDWHFFMNVHNSK